MQNELEFTDEAQAALDLMYGGHGHLFVTGAAGTGKSTLIRHFLATTSTQAVVLAPTGVAALAVGGQTIHSFFRFGLGITPDKAGARHDEVKRLCERIDTFIIDEASMVRADLFDCIERRLRTNGREPGTTFGGHQVVLVGDLYQLSPVVTEEQAGIFEGYYRSPYFFDAHVCRRIDLAVIELTRVYRQDESDYFAQMLARMRLGEITDGDLTYLNQHVRQPTLADLMERPLLAPLNSIIDTANAKCLRTIKQPLVSIPGIVSGEFQARTVPTPDPLVLKEGARVMALANHPEREYVNGTLGVIESLEGMGEDGILFRSLDSGRMISVAPYEWERIRYVAVADAIVTESIGTYTQYPFRLAYAMTIHKSQGKTLPGAIVSPGRGFFTFGQAYVALSRLSSDDDLWLTRAFRHEDILVDERVHAFYSQRVSRQMPLF